MDSANKVISFVLGLVVVVVFLIVVTGRFNLKTLTFFPQAKTSLSPSPTNKKVISTVAIPNKEGQADTYKLYNQYSTQAESIPNTGAPTILLPFAISTLFGGIYLKKKSK